MWVEHGHRGKHSSTYCIIDDPFDGHEDSKLGRHISVGCEAGYRDKMNVATGLLRWCR